MVAPAGVAFSVHDRNDLDLIRPLWEGLAAHHREQARANAPAFLEEMATRSFEDRRAEILEKNRHRLLRLELAHPDGAAEPCGYCIASGAPGASGEVESIYVDEAYRNRGIGGALLERALAWMDEIGTVEQALVVFAGNDRALPFYERHGFFPRFVVLVRQPRD